jgi:hypothetical protein
MKLFLFKTLTLSAKDLLTIINEEVLPFDDSWSEDCIAKRFNVNCSPKGKPPLSTSSGEKE